MVTIILLDPWNGYQAGTLLDLDNNVAHGLIEKGKAVLKPKAKEAKDYENRMIGGPEKKSKPLTK